MNRSRNWSLLLLEVLILAKLSIPASAAPPEPSAQLQAYSSSWLEKLLGPLDTYPLPRAQLSQLEVDYQSRMPQAAAPEKQVLHAALDVCHAFGKIMDEREKAVASVAGAEAKNSSSQGSTRSARAKDQKRAEIREGQNDSNFIAAAARDSANRQWRQHQDTWRNTVLQLLVREKQLELAAAVPAAAPAAPTASAPPSPEADPVLGDWLLENRTLVTLAPDHTMTGGRHGTWTYTKTENGARYYELHFPAPKNWVDYLVLSEDGKSMTGHTMNHAAISYYRP